MFGMRRFVAAFKNSDFSMLCKLLDKSSTIKAAISRRTPKIFQATFLASLGAALEYYDFIIYGLMANYLSQLFFPQENSAISLIKTFAIFAIGYLVRPIGGIIFGLMGDAWGRKKALLNVMFLMAFSTLCIGLLPTYADLGDMSALFLLILRCLQGISFGAELPGAITVVNEYSEKHQKSFFSSLVVSSVTMGSLFASFVMYLLSIYFSHSEMIAGAWRIPFILGGSLALINLVIRKYLDETPEFLQLKRDDKQLKAPLIKLIKEYPLEIVLGIGMTSLAAFLVIFFLYLPTHLSKDFSTKEVFSAVTVALIWSIFTVPLSGRMADRIGHRKLLLISCCVIACSAFPLFYLFSFKTLYSLFLGVIIYQTLISLVAGSYLSLLATLFPTEVRYTGIAICYNVAYSLMSCLPIILSQFSSYLLSLATPCLILLSLSCGFCVIIVCSPRFSVRGML